MARPRATLGAWLLTVVWTDLRFAVRSSRSAPAALALLAVGAVASYVPARRVSSINLVTILKRE